MKTMKPKKQKKHTIKKYKKIGGAAATAVNNTRNNSNIPINAMSQSIIKFKDNWYCTMSGECHRTMEGLRLIINDANYTLINIKLGLTVHNYKSIKKYYDKNKHFLLGIRAPGHYFYIEMHNSNIRIISLWSDFHGIYDYYNRGPYGKLQKWTRQFKDSFNKLCSKDDTKIEESLLELFGEVDTKRYNETSKTLKLNVYELLPLDYNSNKTELYNSDTKSSTSKHSISNHFTLSHSTSKQNM